jgi:hypothetical protein
MFDFFQRFQHFQHFQVEEGIFCVCDTNDCNSGKAEDLDDCLKDPTEEPPASTPTTPSGTTSNFVVSLWTLLFLVVLPFNLVVQ